MVTQPEMTEPGRLAPQVVLFTTVLLCFAKWIEKKTLQNYVWYDPILQKNMLILVCILKVYKLIPLWIFILVYTDRKNIIFWYFYSSGSFSQVGFWVNVVLNFNISVFWKFSFIVIWPFYNYKIVLLMFYQMIPLSMQGSYFSISLKCPVSVRVPTLW